MLETKNTEERSIPKILIVAEHASAKFGGEALIPFQYFKRLRLLGADVHLLVHERTKRELCDEFPEDLYRLHFVSDSRVNIWCHRLGRLFPDRLAVFTVGAVSHLDTQIRQRRLARRLVREQHFNIVHEPIPVSPKLPSMISDLLAKVIIGPLNGGMDYPPNYDLSGRSEKLLIYSLRLTAGLCNFVLPGKRRAALLLVANKRTYNALPAVLRRRQVLELVENGVDVDLFKPARITASNKVLRIIYIGRLVDVKRVDLLIDACARLRGRIDFELDVLGDGPLRQVLEQRVERLSLVQRVRFRGRLAQGAAAEILRNADVFVMTSMRECGGAAVLEAMACGVPVIAAAWGGPVDYLTPATGILIPPDRPDIFVEAVANALLYLAENPDARARMGQAARQRAIRLYDWNVKAKALLDIYEQVLMTSSTQTSAGAV